MFLCVTAVFERYKRFECVTRSTLETLGTRGRNIACQYSCACLVFRLVSLPPTSTENSPRQGLVPGFQEEI
jgi:hypothetical protein